MKVLVMGIPGYYGGTETVVSRFMEALSDRCQFDTMCWHMPPQAIFSSGLNRSIVMPYPSRRKQPLRYERWMKSFFRDNASQYHAVWYNRNQLSGVYPLELAARCDIPVRITHYHSTTIHGDSVTKFLSVIQRKEYLRFSTKLFAASEEAGEFAFGGAPFETIYNAFDTSGFTFSNRARREIRDELGLGDAFVIGTVGRLSPQKNHLWLIGLMPYILRMRPEARLVIIGEGELRGETEAKIRELGLADRVMLTGARPDISRCLSAFDVFAFPSLWEGLGVSVVEAQANGLPCVASDHVPSLACVSGSFHEISLNEKDAWVDTLCASSRSGFLSDEEKLARFDISIEAERLWDVLRGEEKSL